MVFFCLTETESVHCFCCLICFPLSLLSHSGSLLSLLHMSEFPLSLASLAGSAVFLFTVFPVSLRVFTFFPVSLRVFTVFPVSLSVHCLSCLTQCSLFFLSFLVFAALLLCNHKFYLYCVCLCVKKPQAHYSVATHQYI